VKKGGLSVIEVGLRKDYFTELWHLLRSKEALAIQKSRSRWLREGDVNSQYFHNLMRSRGKRNNILALEVDGEWTENPSIIRQATLDFFKTQFQSCQRRRPMLDGVVFPRLSLEENTSLSCPF
jgi:hypothetical protein